MYETNDLKVMLDELQSVINKMADGVDGLRGSNPELESAKEMLWRARRIEDEQLMISTVANAVSIATCEKRRLMNTVNDVDVYIEVMYTDSLPFDDGLGLYELPNNYQYMVVGIGFYNGNNYDVYVSTYDFQVYADNILCNEEYIYADGIESSATISSGRQAIIYGVYEVPQNANTVEIEYTQDFLSDTVVITVDETSDWSG